MVSVGRSPRGSFGVCAESPDELHACRPRLRQRVTKPSPCCSGRCSFVYRWRSATVVECVSGPGTGNHTQQSFGARKIHGHAGSSFKHSFHSPGTCSMDSRFCASPMSALRARLPSAIGAILVCAATLHAHEGESLKPHDLWSAWQFPPGIVIPLALSGVIYPLGIWRSRHRSLPQILAYAAGWIALSIALISPVHPLGEVLFSAHMAQHTVLMLVAAPLLVLGRPLV